MASAFSHAIVALALGKAPRSLFLTWPVILLGIICSFIPDLDVIGFSLGIHYEDLWGHRGMTHSLLFAALCSTMLVGLWFRQRAARARMGIFCYLFLCTTSHGVLDAMTNGGLGVAFFSPFDTERYFFSWRPVLVSPIGIGEFFNTYGLRVLASEMIWIWLPSLMVYLLIRLLSASYPPPPSRGNASPLG